MVVFLDVFRKKKDSSKEKLGTLEIGTNKPYGESNGRYFEWRGANGTSDGGIWKWENHPMYLLGDYIMVLISNETKAIVVTLINSDWGLTEPTDPIFKTNAGGTLSYYMPTGNAITASWKRI